MAEKWLPVVGYEGIYEVRPGSDGGRVRRVQALARTRVGRLLGGANCHGYVRAVLSAPGRKPKHVYLHTLILEAFVGPCPPGHEACHEDDVRTNNTLKNLSWGTRSRNMDDMVRNGRHGKDTKPGSYKRGEAHHNSRLTDAQRADIKRRWPAETKADLARAFDVSKMTIARVLAS